jgi:hypothetical protein
MFFSTGHDDQIDPALLAFVKCHVTSPSKWEALRVLAAQEGSWLGIEQLARATHKQPVELASTLSELVSEGVLEVETANGVSYRLPPSEPTSVVLHRLIEEATHSLELRGIIAACVARGRRLSGPASATAAA